MLARKSFRLEGFRVLSSIALLCAGCGASDSLQRVAMFGKVTLDGAPLASGSISLLPIAGNNAPSANGTIQEGEYRFDRENGPTAGEYQVLVMHSAGDSRSSKATSFQSRTAERREWNQKVSVPPASEFEHDILLKTAADSK